LLKKTLILTTTICAIAIRAIVQPAYAQISEFKIAASDGTGGDNFGWSVSISGDYAVVGAILDDDNGDWSGSAYVFKRAGTSWAQEAKLLPSDGAVEDRFGNSVSISGDYAVVGARWSDDNGSGSGSAYLYNLQDPFVVSPIMDVVADEDFGSIMVALLDTVFEDLDLPNDSLRYTVSVSSGLATGSISGDTLRLFSEVDSNGMAEVIVTATDDSSTSASDTFNVLIVPAGAGPASFSLAFPSGDTLNTLLPAFSWHTPVDPAFGSLTVYIFRISTFETLLSPIVTETLSDTSYTSAVLFADDSLYFWSVIAFDTSGGFAFSDTSSFLLDIQESPLPFSLISPEGSIVDSLRPVFTWESSKDPDPRDVVKYTLIIKSGTDTVYISAGIEDVTHQVTEDIPRGSYKWFVVAEDADEDSLDTRSSEIFRLGVFVGIDDELAGIPEEFNLYQNYPNPFNPSTLIKYALPKSSNVSLVIYNLMGQGIMTWEESNVPPGYYEITWNGATRAGIPVSSGMYIYRIVAGDFVSTNKMVLLR